MRRTAGTGERGDGAAVVRSVLQGYANRGVFRGLRLANGAGRVEAEFVWLMGRPMRASYEWVSDRLRFPALLPGVDPRSALGRDLRAIVRARATAGVPVHKRVDGRRARLECRIAGGALSLSGRIRGRNHEYVVRRMLGLINDMFLLLHASYPDYLVERFGLSTE